MVSNPACVVYSIYDGTYPRPTVWPLKHSVGARLKKSNYHKSAMCSVFLEATQDRLSSPIKSFLGVVRHCGANVVAVIEFSHQRLLANTTNEVYT